MSNLTTSNLTTAALRDASQTVINVTTTIWYGTFKEITRGQVVVCAPTQTSPMYVIIHPDDVPLLGPGARHLRDYRPTRADLAEQARQWLDAQRGQVMEFRK